MIGVRRSFDEGTLVRHRRHGYRGVVVAFDAWYGANRTDGAHVRNDEPWPGWS